LLPGATAQGFPAVATASGGGTPAPPTARDGLRRLPRPGAGQRNQTADAAGGQKAKGAGAPQQDAAQQISQELAQNLQKLKLVIQETQQIARKMEAILGESAGQSGY
ncbi:MAG: hypothetical protein IRY95_04055, partial [Clostridia bacterium]|nr:hypothetical protein [Clostridia bacterium]